MFPPAVVEQQAKLGVSAEESKAQRLKRQQARFRDRGGAFVPSNSNPLVDILLARTVSGESPSRARPKDTKRLSLSKAYKTSGTVTASDEGQAVARSSKPKLSASRKTSERAAESEFDATTKPTPKRRDKRTKGKKKALEQPSLNAKSKSTLKRKARQNITTPAQSSSDQNPKPKTKAKSNPKKALVEGFISDDDQTLVEVPRKSKSERNIQDKDDGESADDVPMMRKRGIPSADDSPPPGAKIADMGASRKKMVHGERTAQNEKSHRLAQCDDDDKLTLRVIKKGKVTASTSKCKNATKCGGSPRKTEDIKIQETSKPMGNNRKRKVELGQHTVQPVEEVGEQPPERASKSKKRKKEEDILDDRPPKAVKISDIGPPHSSSRKLKENLSNGKKRNGTRSRADDDLYAPTTNPPSLAKKPKGPPREVLERIKASAARHLQCADGEPDELDCLS